MIPVLPPRTRQGLAIALLILVTLLVWFALVGPILNLALSRQADVTILSGEAQELQSLENRAPTIGARKEAARAALQSLGVLWSGPNKVAIAASMQDLVRTAAQQSGGVVSSSSALTENDSGDAHMVGIRARVDGSIGTLQQVLRALDVARPRLFVTNLSISSAAPGTKDQPPQLSFEFSVAGYDSDGLLAN
jgi:hypothetical protein